jgi:hypothetical protein
MDEDKESSPSMPVQAPESPPESDSEDTGTKRRGRPKSSEIASKKPGGRKKVGRPKGDTAIMADYKARMLASPKSRKVITKVFDTALEDGHPHQAACMKMVMDRIAPISSFSEQKGTAGHKIEFVFNMPEGGTVDAKASSDTDDAVDAEYEELLDE